MTQITPFGYTKNGDMVETISIGSSALSAKILTLGGIINDVRLDSVNWPLTLGSSEVAAYEGKLNSFGSLMGPVVNRIKGCSAKIDGVRCEFEKHHSGNLTQHSGNTGMQKQLWTIAKYGPEFVTFELHLEDGLGGFPGNRNVKIQYRVSGSSLTMNIQARTDSPTLFNPANHSYWSLDPDLGFKSQVLQVYADRYTEPDEKLMPTGMLLPTKGSPYDFQSGKLIAGDASQFFDLNLCLSDRREPMRKVAILTGTKGIRMEMATTECGLQVYDCGTINAPGFTTHHGVPYAPYSGLALEAQSWPGATIHAHFPDITLRPEDTYNQRTSWTFTV